MQSRVTIPAAKYGPTPLYGECESAECETKARSTCDTCSGHFCLAHAGHPHRESDLAAGSGAR